MALCRRCGYPIDPTYGCRCGTAAAKPLELGGGAAFGLVAGGFAVTVLGSTPWLGVALVAVACAHLCLWRVLFPAD